MDYKALKNNLVKDICRDPIAFLYVMLGSKGVFYGHVSAPTLGYLPTIMHIADDGEHVSLSVTVWEEGEYLTFDKTTHKAHSTPNENGPISWEFDDTTCDSGYDYQYAEAELFMDKLIFGVAFSEWENLVGDIAARENPQECAWFFPAGVNAACKYPGKMMYASGQDEAREAH